MTDDKNTPRNSSQNTPLRNEESLRIEPLGSMPDDELNSMGIFDIQGDADGDIFAIQKESQGLPIRMVLGEGVSLSNRFRLDKLLRRSNKGETWRASDLQTERNVIVKLLPEAIRSDAALMQQGSGFFKKIQAFQHPHICPLLGTFDDPDHGFFTVTKFLNGKTLDLYRRDYLKKYGKLPAAEAIKMLRDVADALDYAHGQNVFHLEVRPQNVMVDPDAGIQVINFALPVDILADTLKETKPKSVYLSPEERNGGVPDDKSDQYGLAVTAYELLAGSLPFEQDADVTPLPIPGVSSAVDAVIHRAMSRDRDDRYETCQAFISALENEAKETKKTPAKPVIITPNGGTNLSSGQKPVTPKGSSSRWLLIGGLATLFLIAGGAALWYLTQNSTPPPPKQQVPPAAKQPAPPAVDEAAEKAEQEHKAADEAAAKEAAQKKEAEAKAAVEQAEREQKEAEAKRAAEKATAEEERVAAEKATAEAERKQKEDEERAAAVRARELTKQERETAKKAATEEDLKAHKEGELFSLPVDGVEYRFRWCPPGEFLMGSPESEFGHFDPHDPNYRETQHKVTLTRGFWMLETEVTQEMWESVMGKNPSEYRGQKDCPVESVSWIDCRDYVTKLNERKAAPAGYRFSLPTEAQWEYACRAGTVTPFSFGTTLNGDDANSGGQPYPEGIKPGKNYGKTTRVRSYLPNDWGLYDMHGNVCEWCRDWEGNYSSESVTDPTGPTAGAYRIRRGGAWGRNALFCRSADRRRDDSTIRNSRLGLRLAIVVDAKE